MIIHIVRGGETLSHIADHYGALPPEIKSENRHITDWKHLKPGTKIKIPIINANTIEILEETEPFVEEYYPRVESPIIDVVVEVVEDSETIDAAIDVADENEKKEDILEITTELENSNEEVIEENIEEVMDVVQENNETKAEIIEETSIENDNKSNPIKEEKPKENKAVKKYSTYPEWYYPYGFRRI